MFLGEDLGHAADALVADPHLDDDVDLLVASLQPPGTIYFWSLAVVFVSSTTMAALRFLQDWHLLLIGAVAFGAGGLGYLARRRGRPRWERVHIPAMGGSYIVLFTGFYVDNGSNLPLWDRLPHIAYWVLPSLIGIPLILRALGRWQKCVLATPSRLSGG